MKCNHIKCENKATTKGFVLVRNSNGGKDIPTEVFACHKHKNKHGFIETEKL